MSREFQGSFKDILRVSKKVSIVFQENFKKSFKGVSTLECFNEILFSDFVVAWISSQLSEQKKGLFGLVLGTKIPAG